MNVFRLGLVALLLCSGFVSADPVRRPKRAANGLADSTPPGGVRTVEISVTDKGYEPNFLKLKAEVPVKVRITRKSDKNCAREFVLDEHQINVELPLNSTVEVQFTPKKLGTLVYGCRMSKMISGRFRVH